MFISLFENFPGSLDVLSNLDIPSERLTVVRFGETKYFIAWVSSYLFSFPPTSSHFLLEIMELKHKCVRDRHSLLRSSNALLSL